MSAGPGPSRDRIFGLDVMRAAAIILVVFSHADDLWKAWFPYDPGPAAVDGVDLFFVLSGYLIGGILLREFARSDKTWWATLRQFWRRRWLRTLPNYYLFLGINITLVHHGLAIGLLNQNLWAYFVFVQNLHVPLELFFFESWSLGVEEWFYMLFPLFVVLGFMSGIRKRKAFLAAALILIVLPAVLRSIGADTTHGMELPMRRIVIHRLDGIGFGVLASWLHLVLPGVWLRYRRAALLLGSLGLLGAAYLHGDGHLWFNSTWYFTCMSLSMTLLLPMLSTWRSRPIWGRPLVFISHVSYALYLAHLPIRSLWLPLMEDRSMPVTMMLYVCFWMVSIGLAWVVYRYWERPFMDLRERWTKPAPAINPAS